MPITGCGKRARTYDVILIHGKLQLVAEVLSQADRACGKALRWSGTSPDPHTDLCEDCAAKEGFIW